MAVFGTTTTGRRVRVLAETPEDSELRAGFEIGVRLCEDGQWILAWMPDSEIVELEMVDEDRAVG